MILIIILFLFCSAYFTCNTFENKKFQKFIHEVDKTKAILNVESQGEEWKRIQLQQQMKQILNNHKTTNKKMKKNLERIVNNERIQELFK